MKLKTKALAAGIVCALTAGVVFAADDDNPFAAGIKARQAAMQLQAFNLGILGGMARGKTEYDAKAAMQAATNLHHAVSIHQPQAWAPGSDNSAVKGTRALPALWQNFPDAGAKSKELAAAVEELKAVAGNGAEAIGSAIGRVGAACGACHKAYRAPGN